MPPQLKKVLLWVFWIFIIYAIVTDPARAAEVIRSVWDLVLGALGAIAVFFNKILGR